MEKHMQTTNHAKQFKNLLVLVIVIHRKNVRENISGQLSKSETLYTYNTPHTMDVRIDRGHLCTLAFTFKHVTKKSGKSRQMCILTQY